MKNQEIFLGLLRTKPHDFNRRAFFEKFGAYRFTRIAGFREVINSTLLVADGFVSRSHILSAIKGSLGKATNELRPQLSRLMPDGEWRACHGDQVMAAFSGEALRFDKACIVVKALEIALRREALPALSAIDIYKFISLHPTIYVLRHLDKWRGLADMPQRLDEGEQQLLARLKVALMPSHDYGILLGDDGHMDVFMWEAINGAPISWRSAEIFCRIFNEVGPTKGGSAGSKLLVREVSAERLKSRNDNGRRVQKKLCNQFEGPFLGLDEELIDELSRVCPPRDSFSMD
jgi:hypothetical protein